MKIRKIFKKLNGVEAWGRAFRPYLFPSQQNCYRLLKERKPPKEYPEGKYVVFDIKDTEKMDVAHAQYSYSFVQDFVKTGYKIIFTQRYPFLASVKSRAMKPYIFDKIDYVISHKKAPPSGAILISDDKNYHHPNYTKKVLLDYQRRLPESETELPAPFPLSPGISHLNLIPSKVDTYQRHIKVLFAGSAFREAYTQPMLRKKYNVMARYYALEHIRESYKSEYFAPKTLDEIFEPKNRDLVISDRSQDSPSIPPQQWMQLLQQSSFYLALPGATYPLCFNLVESLASGAIPILEYSRYLFPPLTHRENSLHFHDKSSLIEAIDTALNMEESEIAHLRANARAYYEEHLAEGVMAKTIETHPKHQLTLLQAATQAHRPNKTI